MSENCNPTNALPDDVEAECLAALPPEERDQVAALTASLRTLEADEAREQLDRAIASWREQSRLAEELPEGPARATSRALAAEWNALIPGFIEVYLDAAEREKIALDRREEAHAEVDEEHARLADEAAARATDDLEERLRDERLRAELAALRHALLNDPALLALQARADAAVLAARCRPRARATRPVRRTQRRTVAASRDGPSGSSAGDEPPLADDERLPAVVVRWEVGEPRPFVEVADCEDEVDAEALREWLAGNRELFAWLDFAFDSAGGWE